MKNKNISPWKYFLVGFISTFLAIAIFIVYLWIGFYFTFLAVVIIIIILAGKKGIKLG